MTERERFEIQDQRQEIFARDFYTCRTCGRSIYQYGSQQVAHRIAQTKANIKKYGKAVIHHSNNLASVCCLRCNDAQNIGNQTEIADALAESIRCSIRQE